jgi:hypothetical protein
MEPAPLKITKGYIKKQTIGIQKAAKKEKNEGKPEARIRSIISTHTHTSNNK